MVVSLINSSGCDTRIIYASCDARCMTDESYRKCRTCRYCVHEGDSWVCMPGGETVGPDSTCGRYRPGCCENCSGFSDGYCSKKGMDVFELDVCDDYDPHSLLGSQ